MSDIIDGFREMRKHREQTGQRRRESAESGFAKAATLAAQNGMRLVRHSAAHYSLTIPLAKWRWELYPGNQRIYTHGPWKKAGTPFLVIHDRPWTLLAVVMAAAQEWQNAKERP